MLDVAAGRVHSADGPVVAALAAILTEHDRAHPATALLEYALHLRMHGERAPGGNETWAEFDVQCETYLRRLAGQKLRGLIVSKLPSMPTHADQAAAACWEMIAAVAAAETRYAAQHAHYPDHAAVLVGGDLYVALARGPIAGDTYWHLTDGRLRTNALHTTVTVGLGRSRAGSWAYAVVLGDGFTSDDGQPLPG